MRKISDSLAMFWWPSTTLAVMAVGDGLLQGVRRADHEQSDEATG